jgi:hypothetical protein
MKHSIKEDATYNREVLPLVKYAKTHEDRNCLLITYYEEGTGEGIPEMPVWKWLMDV